MITVEEIMSVAKSDLQERSKTLDKDDLSRLVEWLSLEDDNIRYQAFLMLKGRSQFTDDVYPYWHVFQSKLQSGNSYQRSIGLMLIAENAKWDSENRMAAAIDAYLTLLDDEKPITIRQCIQSLGEIASCKPDLNKKISDRLISFDLTAVKETMRKSILLDIINVLLIIRKALKTAETEAFILEALSGELLDKKSKKQIENLLL